MFEPIDFKPALMLKKSTSGTIFTVVVGKNRDNVFYADWHGGSLKEQTKHFPSDVPLFHIVGGEIKTLNEVENA